MTRLRLGLSHLREYKFKLFKIRLILQVTVVVKLNLQFIFSLYCPLFTNERSTLFSTSHNLDSKLFDRYSLLTKILLFSKESLNINQNTASLNTIMEFILSAKKFDEPIFIN